MKSWIKLGIVAWLGSGYYAFLLFLIDIRGHNITRGELFAAFILYPILGPIVLCDMFAPEEE